MEMLPRVATILLIVGWGADQGVRGWPPPWSLAGLCLGLPLTWAVKGGPTPRAGPSPAPGAALGSSIGKWVQRNDRGGCGPQGGGTGSGSHPGSQVPSSRVSLGTRGAAVREEGGPGLAAPRPQAERGGQLPRGRRAPAEGPLEGRCQPLLAGKGPLGLRHRHRPFRSFGLQCPRRLVGGPPSPSAARARGQPASGPRARLVKLHPPRHPVYARGDRLGGESATQ